MYQKFGIKKEILDLSEEVEKEIQPIFKNIEKIEEINSLKVLSAFQECGLSEMHLNSSTGYGIDEIGRNKIEEIYAKIFNAECISKSTINIRNTCSSCNIIWNFTSRRYNVKYFRSTLRYITNCNRNK